MELNQNLMVQGLDVSVQEKGTTVGHEKKAGVTNLAAEIVMMTITEKEAVNVKGIAIGNGIVTGKETEKESIVIAKQLTEEEHLERSTPTLHRGHLAFSLLHDSVSENLWIKMNRSRCE